MRRGRSQRTPLRKRLFNRPVFSPVLSVAFHNKPVLVCEREEIMKIVRVIRPLGKCL